MRLEDTYIRALHGVAPDADLVGEVSSRQCRALIESLAQFFSSRLPNETHILAALMLGEETAKKILLHTS